MASPTRRSSTLRPALIASAIAALLVFVAGFGAMLAFWLNGKNNPHLKGLWSYPSATYGDGLLLPVLMGTLVGVAWYLSARPSRKQETWIAVSATGLGFAAGAATQVAWLVDSKPTLNWTLPRPGHFTGAGWYHAIFLCCMVALLMAVVALLYLRLRASRQNVHEPNSIAIVLVIDGLTFVWLIIHDSVSGSSVALAGVTSAIGVVTAIGILVGLAVSLRQPLALSMRHLAGYTLLVIPGSLGTAATILWMDKKPTSYIVISLVCASGVGVSTTLRLRYAGSNAASVIGFTTAMAMIGSLVVASPHRLPASVAVIAIVSLALVGAAYSFQLQDMIGPAHWLAFFAIGVLIAIAPWVSSTSKTVAVWCLGIAIALIQAVYILIKHVYRRAASFAEETRHQPPQAPSAVAELLPLGAVALVAYYYFVISASRAARLETRSSSAPWAAHPWWGACAVLALCATAALITRRFAMTTPGGGRNRALIPHWAIILISASVTGWVLLLAFYFRPPQHLWLWYIVAALVVSTLLGILTAESIMMSPVVLQDREPTLGSRMLAILSGIAVFVSISWLALTGVWSGNHAADLPNALASLGVSFLGGYGIAILCGVTVAISGNYGQITEDPPWYNTMQDQLLYMAMGAFGVWSTAVAFGRTPDQELSHLGVALGLLCSLLAPFAQLFVFVMSNNFMHLSRQLQRARELHEDSGRPLSPEDWHKALRLHISVQTVLALSVAVIIVSAAMATILSNLSTFADYLAKKLR
jgi:hypothetical protein